MQKCSNLTTKLKSSYVKCIAEMCLFPFSVINLRRFFFFFHKMYFCPSTSSLCNLSEQCFEMKTSQVIFLWNGNMPWFCPPMRMKMFLFVSSIMAKIFWTTSLFRILVLRCLYRKTNIMFKLIISFLYFLVFLSVFYMMHRTVCLLTRGQCTRTGHYFFPALIFSQGCFKQNATKC